MMLVTGRSKTTLHTYNMYYCFRISDAEVTHDDSGEHILLF